MEKLLSTVLLFAAIGLASCSDEIVDQNTVNPNEIRYKAVADIASRADSVYSQELKPLSFYLLSNIGGGDNNSDYGSTYISEELASRVDETFYYSRSGTHYWPADKVLDFFAYYNTFSDDPTSGQQATHIKPTVVPNATTHSTTLTFANVCIPVLDYNQRDLIYAVSLNRTKTSNNSNVTFRFKHALAQLIFKLKCTNDNLYVMANGVNVYHVPRVGTLSFGTTDTGTDSEDLCTWSNVQASTQTISIDMDHGTGNIAEAFNYRTYNSDGTIATSGSLIEAITNDAANNPDKATGLMVIPTTYTSWVPPTDLTGWDSSTLGISGTTYQTYVGLKCRVWRFSNKAAKNISSATFFDDTQAHAESCLREMDAELVYGGADGSFSEILIPLPTTTDNAAGGTWKAGWKYIYTFVFGSGDGGYSPDDGNKVLRSIGFGMEITPFDNTLVDRDHDMEEVESGS